MGSFKKPMLCQNIHPDQLLGFIENSKSWVCQDKIDGCRAIVSVQAGKVTITGRNNTITHRYPEFDAMFKPDANLVIDAEICTYDLNFNHLQHRDQNNNPFKIAIVMKRYPCRIYAFDLLECYGHDLTGLPYHERLNQLQAEVAKQVIEQDKIVVLPVYMDIMGRWNHQVANKQEGIILKRIDAPYQYGKRSANYVKCKNWKETIIEFTKYEVNPAGITVEDAKGTRCLVAGRSSVKVRQLLDANGSVRLEIQYLEVTKNGAYRMPTFKHISQ